MSTRRTAKVAEAIRQVVSSAILFELRDPRVKHVTVLSAEIPEDLRTAKIKVSILGDEKETSLTLHGLNSARGWLQSKIADELQLRYTPIITFVVDTGLRNTAAVSEILRQIALERGPDGVSEEESDIDQSDGLEDDEPDLDGSLNVDPSTDDPDTGPDDDHLPAG